MSKGGWQVPTMLAPDHEETFRVYIMPCKRTKPRIRGEQRVRVARKRVRIWYYEIASIMIDPNIPAWMSPFKSRVGSISIWHFHDLFTEGQWITFLLYTLRKSELKESK